MFERITFNPNVMGGRACIRGMRITVSLVVNLVADGMSTDEIFRNTLIWNPRMFNKRYPNASELAGEEVHPFTSPAA